MKTRSLMILFLALSCSSCEPPKKFPAATAGGGFYVQTFGRDDTTTGVPFTAGGVQIRGVFDHDNTNCVGGSPVGDPYAPSSNNPSGGWTFTSSLDFGLIQVLNGRICAYWNFNWMTPFPFNGCQLLPTIQGYVPMGTPYQTNMQYTCIKEAGGGIGIADAAGIQFSPSPTFTDVTSGTITARGSGFSGAYGMPLFQYFDQNGNLVAQTNATSVASDGSSATGPVPSNIGSVLPGFYVGRANNAASGGSYTYLSAGGVVVANGGVTIYGGEQSTQVCTQWAVGGDCLQWATVYDYGTVSITINGVTSSVSYGQYDTPSSVVSNLANAINSNTSINTLVSATAWAGTQVLINVTQSGSHYSLSATATTSDPQDFPDGSFFSPYPSAPTL